MHEKGPHLKEPLSVSSAVFTVLKAMIGTGILALPKVCGSVGLALAVPGLLFIALLNLLGTWRLAECIHILSDDDSPSSESDNEVSDGASDSSVSRVEQEDDCGLGPVATIARETLGTWAIVVSALCGLGNQFGAGIAYFLVIVETLHSSLLPKFGVHVSVSLVRVVIGVICMQLGLIKQLNSLAWMSVVALVSYCYVAIALGRWSSAQFSSGAAPEDNLWTPIHWENVGTYFGASIFAFEGVFLAQHVYADMQLKTSQKGRPFLKVLLVSYPICFIAYLYVGMLGYMAYGSEVCPIIYLNFPSTSIDTTIIQGVLIIVLFVSFALQMFPVFVFLDSQFCGTNMHKAAEVEDDGSDSEVEVVARGTMIKGRKRKKVGDFLMRYATVAMTCTVAVLVPNIEEVMGYVGSFALSTIGFILPALFHIAASKKMRRPISLKGWITDIVLIISGATAFILGLIKLASQIFEAASPSGAEAAPSAANATLAPAPATCTR
mmetsp:Transcript_37509/g.119341  ORF Transcript_37509/g.119341 Transcript_37509/m.119341 type:complete len:493 (-) Transcript_37509:209-1687(-)